MFAPGAGRFLGPVGAVTVALPLLVAMRLLSGTFYVAGLFALALAATIFFAVFFRDPDRPPGAGVVSAADGRVRAVQTEGDRLRISVFMNVTDVHVNRLPVDATVESMTTSGAGFRPAYRPDASHNVQRSYRLSTALGPVDVVQMTGILARRLVAFVEVGATGHKGDRFGMIVLGSRVDVVLPAARVIPTVRVGDRVRAGTSTIARERP